MSRPRHPQLVQARRDEAARARQVQQRAGRQRLVTRAEARPGLPLPAREPTAPRRAGVRPSPASMPKVGASRPAGAPRAAFKARRLPPERDKAPAHQPRAVPRPLLKPDQRPPREAARKASARPGPVRPAISDAERPRAAPRPAIAPSHATTKTRHATPAAPRPASSAVSRPDLPRAASRPVLPRAERPRSTPRHAIRAAHHAAPSRPIDRRSLRSQPVAAPIRARLQAPRRAAVAVADRAASPTGLGWLSAAAGSLRGADGAVVRLLGLRSQGGSADTDLRDAQALLAQVAPGQRCVAVSLALAAQMKPAALAALDARIALNAEAGIYTLLRMEARLWMHGHHLRVARRYAQQPAALFALIGRSPLAKRLWAAAQAVRAAHPRAVVWLPLESARAALAAGADEGVGLLWDAARPQGPHAAVLQGTLRQPVLLDGWQPAAHHPLAHDRLMSLCRQGGVGWLARSPGAWLASERGMPVLSRAAHVLQRAVHLSS